ncbi:hypothetical protein D3C79_1116720 [compost metagenome]
MHGVGNARRLTPEEQDVIFLELVIRIGNRRLGGEQHDAASGLPAPVLEVAPVRMAGEGGLL